MIRIEFDQKTGYLTKHIKGDSQDLLFELHVLIDTLLESFHAHGQELLVLDEITDVVSEFAEEHTSKQKENKKND